MPTGVYERTPETRAILSKAHTDVKLSPEHCAAMSKGTLGVPRTTPAQIAADEAKRGVPNTPEHNAAISKAKTGVSLAPEHIAAISRAADGVPNSPEHNAAISKALQESDAHKAAAESMHGGNDICEHHFIYDHSDLSLNTVQITRSDHTSLHNVLKSLGYIVPHINQ